jgi:hypothetical protein
MTYKHGVAGGIIPSVDIVQAISGTLPIYVGTAPVQQTAAFMVNEPVLAFGFDDAKAKLGYSDDWSTFTLCEAVDAHFKNKVKSIGPIILVNVFDPATHKVAGTKSVTLTNSVGYIDDPVILSSVAVTGKVLGTDFTVEYTTDGRVKFTALTAIASPVTVNYDKMDITKVTDSVIVGGTDANGKRTGLACVELVEQKLGLIPSLLVVPKFSISKTVYDEMALRCQKVNGHYDMTFCADLDAQTNDTIAEAIAAKTSGGRTSVLGKVGWPKVKDGSKIYNMSTIMALRMQQTDSENDDTPYVSPSNKQIGATAVCLANGTELFINETDGNVLNAEGITTAIYGGGVWRLWGPHMGNYKSGTTMKPEDRFDASVRMLRWLSNQFQIMYLNDVDGPLTRKTVERILDDSDFWMNGLVKDGKILFGKIYFNQTSNPDSEIVEGNFVFDVQATTTPVGKSLTFNIQYTSAGIATLFGGEE